MNKKSILLVLAILGPSIILRAYAMDIFLPCIPAVAEYYAVPFATSQWVLSSFFLGAGIGQLFLGPWSDQYGRRPVLLISTIMVVVTSFACTFIENIYVLMAVRFLQGIGGCGTTVVTTAIVRDLYGNMALPRVYSYYSGIVSIAPLTAPLLGGYLLLHTGAWQTTFYFITVFGLLALFVNYMLVQETNQEATIHHHVQSRVSAGKQGAHSDSRLAPKRQAAPGVLSDYVKILFDPMFRNYTFLAILGLSSLFTFFSTSSILIINILGVSPHVFGYYFTLDAFLYLVANSISPNVQQKIGVKQTIFFATILMLIGGLGMILCDLLFGLTVWGFLAPDLLVAFGVGLMIGPCMAGAMQHYKHMAGVASAAYGALLYGVSAVLVGAIMQIKFNNALLPGTALTIMALLSIAISKKLLRN